MSLANKALLVNLNISQWTGFKKDKRATATVEFSHGTDSQVGNFNKRLLPKAKELEDVGKVAGQIRTFFYDQTLPWFNDGSRILSSLNYLTFQNDFRKLKADYETAVDKFINTYPSLKATAKQKLGDLFSDADYPETNELRRRFACEIRFMPIPSVSDFRVDILDEEKERFLESMREVEQNAMADVYRRLHEVVRNASDKLHEPNAIFRKSLINNIIEVAKTLPRLNVTNDANIDALCNEAEKLANSLDQDALRTVPKERESAAKELDAIADKMAAFMGSN